MSEAHAPLQRVLEPFKVQVYGVPVPQGSKTAFVRGERAVIVDGTSPSGRAKHKAWRAAVTEVVVNEKDGRRFEGPVRVSITFLMPPISSDPHRTLHATKPDIDKLARSILDSLTDSGIIRDDSQVCELNTMKLYARDGHWTGATIIISDLDEFERAERVESKARAKASRAR